MIAEVNWFGWDEALYHAALVNDAARDVVFLMEIRHEAEEGFKCSKSETPSFVERAVHYLLDNSAIIGRGEPGTISWKIATEFEGESSTIAKQIVKLWSADKESFDCLVFIIRDVKHAV